MSKFKSMAFAFVAALALPLSVLGQSTLGQQQLGRAYWHVFIAYALCWIIVGGWLFHIVRRLKQVEERLGSGRD